MIYGFNPHSHRGSDLKSFVNWMSKVIVSIHTPTGGVTPGLMLKLWWKEVSIHTPTGGVTSYGSSVDAILMVSIHTPTGGVTVTIVTY